MRKLALPSVLALAAMLLAGCASGASTAAPPPPPVFTPSWITPSAPGTLTPAVTAPAAQTATAPATQAVRTRYPATWKLPDRKLSPGAVQPGYTIADICPHVNPALEAMRPSSADKAKVYAAYGITHHVTGQYEVDHIVPVELLGLVDAPAADPAENLYPELNDTPDPAMIAKYRLDPAFIENSKDILEDVLHRDVCAGTVPLATAQHAIATDWRKAYVRYVGPAPVR